MVADARPPRSDDAADAPASPAAQAPERADRPRAYPRARTTVNRRELAHYFDYSPYGIEVIEDGLKEMTFGEYLIEQKALTRYQLLRALQMQDKYPSIRLGECIAALGFLRVSEVQNLLRSWKAAPVLEIE